MTSPHRVRPLSGADAQILDLLGRVVQVVERRHLCEPGQGRAAVHRIAATHLRPRDPQRPTATLTPRTAHAITAAANGKTRPQIAADMGSNVHAINELLRRAARDIGTDTIPQAIAAVASRRVRIEVRTKRRTAA